MGGGKVGIGPQSVARRRRCRDLVVYELRRKRGHGVWSISGQQAMALPRARGLQAVPQGHGVQRDYYASVIRSYFDGKQAWLRTISGNGAPYRAGDLWGSVGARASGRWRDRNSLNYVKLVKRYLRLRVWAQPYFVGK